jgi:lipid-binding SYLF domain-containing protein
VAGTIGRNVNKEYTVMRNSISGKSFIRALATLVFAAGAMLLVNTASAQAASGTINFTLYKAGFIVGGSGGNGTMTVKGKKYPISVGGVSLGATIGVSKAELVGQVYNLKKPGDIEGTYTAVQAGVAVAGGGKVAELKNSKGVVLKVKGQQVGLELALDLSGMEVSLKK